jgi:ABC-2 type transport system ATP-binding protein
MIQVQDLGYRIGKTQILNHISLSLSPGAWLAVLGENGSGKTTLLDLLMGFKAPTQGKILIEGRAPHEDPALERRSIAYLSEKVDLPGDWSVGEFLKFNAFFYPTYDPELEETLCVALRVDRQQRVGNLSAGQIRRAQIVGALSYRPKLILIDEITAVLDIVGRRRLMMILKDRVDEGSSIVFATNILEGLFGNVTDVLLMSGGKMLASHEISETLLNGNETVFYNQVAERLGRS